MECSAGERERKSCVLFCLPAHSFIRYKTLMHSGSVFQTTSAVYKWMLFTFPPGVGLECFFTIPLLPFPSGEHFFTPKWAAPVVIYRSPSADWRFTQTCMHSGAPLAIKFEYRSFVINDSDDASPLNIIPLVITAEQIYCIIKRTAVAVSEFLSKWINWVLISQLYYSICWLRNQIYASEIDYSM